MKYTFQFMDDVDKQRILFENQDKYVIEERNLLDGNYLVFSDSEDIHDRVSRIEEQMKTLLDSQVEDDGLVTETEEQTQTRLQKLLNFWRG